MEPWLTEVRTQNSVKWFKFLEKNSWKNSAHVEA